MNNRKVVFLEVNSSYSHSMLSYCLIRAYAEQEVPEWRWGHVETTLKGSIPDTLDELLKLAPDVLFATAYVFNLDFLREVFSRYKRLCPAVKIILGGPSFLGDNRPFLLANQFVSAVVRGDESSVPALLRQQGNPFPETIPGLCWIAADGEYFDNGIAAFAEDFDALPSPCDKPYIHQDKPFYQLETSRGCGAQCVFCTSSCSPGVKYFSLERVRSDLTALKNKDFREVRLIDRTFNEETERAVSMLRMFYDEFPEMKFHLEIHPARLKPELVECLKQAPQGQLHVEAGVQSFCPYVLRKIKRPGSAKAAEQGLNALLQIGKFEVHADLITGLPGQTAEDVLTDIKIMTCIGPHEIQLEILKILPGTALSCKIPDGMSFNQEPPWDVTATREMNCNDLKKTAEWSCLLDSWYNPPPLRNVFRFCFVWINDFIETFADYAMPHCEQVKGRMALQKRFELLEKFCRRRDRRCLELCRFAAVAAGFNVESLPVSKKLSEMPQNGIPLWRKLETADLKTKRYIIMDCSFNAGDFFFDGNRELSKRPYRYLFELHYGRNVSAVSQLSL